MLITILLNPPIVPVFPALTGGFSGTEKKTVKNITALGRDKNYRLAWDKKQTLAKKKDRFRRKWKCKTRYHATPGLVESPQ